MLVPDYPWPTTSGGRVRAAGIAAALRDLGPLRVLAPDGPEGGPAWLAACRVHGRRRASPARRIGDLGAGIALGRHVLLQRASRAGLGAALAAEIAALQPSVVILGRPFWGPLVDVARARSRVVAEADESLAGVSRSVLASRAPAAARLRALADLSAVWRMERRDHRRVDEVWVSSDVEWQVVTRWTPPDRVRIVPNAAPDEWFASEGPADPQAVAFVGYYRYPPNEEAALELITSVMPILRRHTPAPRLVLIGREPTARMRAAAAGSDDVRITGEVASPRDDLRAAGILAMPIRTGGGSRVKALEAAAARVPIVSTAFGISGLPFRPGRDVLLAETADDFADAIRRLWTDPLLRERLAASAFEVARQHHSAAALRTTVADAIGSLLARAIQPEGG